MFYEEQVSLLRGELTKVAYGERVKSAEFAEMIRQAHSNRATKEVTGVKQSIHKDYSFLARIWQTVFHRFLAE
ncbi:hypothetical protein HYR54_10140 [Candidatus Acetothermia bacterium]|nr:hypothetical protein [Candidatus Acetothermia bacterium]